jgi:hypothetical protein
MCRSIKKLRSSEPTPPEDIEAAALQFIRKVSGQRTPTKKSEEAFNEAVAAVTRVTAGLLESMGTTPSNPNALPPLPPRTRAQRERDKRTEIDFNSSYTAREMAERQGVGPFDMKKHLGILRDVPEEEYQAFLEEVREGRKEMPRELEDWPE